MAKRRNLQRPSPAFRFLAAFLHLFIGWRRFRPKHSPPSAAGMDSLIAGHCRTCLPEVRFPQGFYFAWGLSHDLPMTIPNDTSKDAERIQLELLREKTPAERLMLAARLSHEVIQASKRAIVRVHPELTPRQVEHLFIELHYGRELADGVRRHDGEPGYDR